MVVFKIVRLAAVTEYDDDTNKFTKNQGNLPFEIYIIWPPSSLPHFSQGPRRSLQCPTSENTASTAHLDLHSDVGGLHGGSPCQVDIIRPTATGGGRRAPGLVTH
jgi:hypothetical protein